VTGTRQRIVPLTAALCAAVFVLMLSIAAAFAHAQLVASDPADGTVLTTAPERLTLTFSEPARPLVARLVHPDGRTVVLTEIGDKRSLITLTLPGGLENGTYVLSWRVASSDGHPVGGGLIFSVGAPSAVAPAGAEQSDMSVRIGLWAARLVLMLGLIVGIGGVAFAAFIDRSDAAAADRIVTGALLAGLLAAPILIGFQGLDALAAPLSDLARGEVWAAGIWATSYGRSTLIAVAALCLACASRQTDYRSRPGSWLAVASVALVGIALASAGHASTAPPRYLTVPAVFLHAVAVVLWIGALVPLAGLLRSGPLALIVLRRFSSAIPPVVGVLVFSGMMLAVVQVQTVSALWSTEYGLVLLAKLALVGAMFALAAINRYRLTAPALAGEAQAVWRLTRIVRVEIVLATIVIAALGLWRFTPPPRAMAANPSAYESQEVIASNEGVAARVSIHPPITGQVRIELRDLTLDGKPFEPLGISIDLEKPSYGLGPFARAAARSDDGVYRADGLILPLDGFWIIRVTVLVSDFRSVTLMDVFDVRKPSQ
jgi:copper transport protein